METIKYNTFIEHLVPTADIISFPLSWLDNKDLGIDTEYNLVYYQIFDKFKSFWITISMLFFSNKYNPKSISELKLYHNSLGIPSDFITFLKSHIYSYFQQYTILDKSIINSIIEDIIYPNEKINLLSHLAFNYKTNILIINLDTKSLTLLEYNNSPTNIRIIVYTNGYWYPVFFLENNKLNLHVYNLDLIKHFYDVSHTKYNFNNYMHNISHIESIFELYLASLKSIELKFIILDYNISDLTNLSNKYNMKKTIVDYFRTFY